MLRKKTLAKMRKHMSEMVSEISKGGSESRNNFSGERDSREEKEEPKPDPFADNNSPASTLDEHLNVYEASHFPPPDAGAPPDVL